MLGAASKPAVAAGGLLPTLALLAVVVARGWSPTAAPKAMNAMKAFPTSSTDITREAAEIASWLRLTPGSSICEIGGGNGTLLKNLLPRVLPGGHYYGTGLTEVETGAMLKAASKVPGANTDADVNVYVAKELASGLPVGVCDAMVLRMVYHMLPNPKEYLADFKKAIKPDGLLFIMEHNPDNGKTTREGAKLSVQMMGKRMDMPVVPDQALIEELTAVGFKLVDELMPFSWAYFGGEHYVKGSGNGYMTLFKKKPLCNCACGQATGQCGAGCTKCDCEGCS